MGRLDGKVALITGGVSGLGLATAERFVREGAAVAVLDLQDEKGAELEERLGEQVHYVHADVTDEAQVEAAVASTMAAFGRVDVVMSNAGTTQGPRVVEDVDPESFDQMMHQHTLAAMYLVKHTAPDMRSRRSGSVIVTGSTAGLMAGYGPMLYSIAKAAATHLVRVLCAELGADGIRINCLSPGLVATPIHARAVGMGGDVEAKLAEVRAATKGFQPLQRSGLPDDIANAALFLASDESAFVSGVTLAVDGGLSSGVFGAMRETSYRPVWDAMGAVPDGR
jgi:NAD(P)-dependent dehydrogenase (short-subunit alcohol dehydrogenase family)